jgi:C1A family cysteine protease
MTSRMYSYVRARQLEATYSDDPSIGNWGISAMRIARGWGSPTEAEWPYDGSAKNWPPKEPVQIDQAAKACRIGAYQRVRTIDDCKRALAQERLVAVSFEIASADWISAPNGYIPMPDLRTRLTGSHSVLIVGYDDKREKFFLEIAGARVGATTDTDIYLILISIPTFLKHGLFQSGAKD